MIRYTVVVDACSFVPHASTDLLLRLHETGVIRILISEEILAETLKALVNKLKISPEKAQKRVNEMRKTLSDAIIPRSESTIALMTNHPDDWHVAATGVVGVADFVVTENLKHFKAGDLAPHGLVALNTSDLLSKCHLADPESVMGVLRGRAEWLKISLPELLERLRTLDILRTFAERLQRDEKWLEAVKKIE